MLKRLRYGSLRGSPGVIHSSTHLMPKPRAFLGLLLITIPNPSDLTFLTQDIKILVVLQGTVTLKVKQDIQLRRL